MADVTLTLGLGRIPQADIARVQREAQNALGATSQGDINQRAQEFKRHQDALLRIQRESTAQQVAEAKRGATQYRQAQAQATRQQVADAKRGAREVADARKNLGYSPEFLAEQKRLATQYRQDRRADYTAEATDARGHVRRLNQERLATRRAGIAQLIQQERRSGQALAAERQRVAGLTGGAEIEGLVRVREATQTHNRLQLAALTERHRLEAERARNRSRTARNELSARHRSELRALRAHQSAVLRQDRQHLRARRREYGAAGRAISDGLARAGLTLGSGSILSALTQSAGALGTGGVIAGGLAIGGALGTAAIVRSAEQLQLLENRLKTLIPEQEKFNQVWRELYEGVQRTGADFEATARFYERIVRATESRGLGGQFDLEAITESLNQRLVLTGVTGNERRNALLQLSQGLAASQLGGDELRTLRESAPGILNDLARGLDVNIGQLKELGRQGELTTEAVLGALSKTIDSTQADFDRLEPTFSRGSAQFLTALQNLGYRFDELTELSSNLGSALAGAAQVLDGISTRLQEIAEADQADERERETAESFSRENPDVGPVTEENVRTLARMATAHEYYNEILEEGAPLAREAANRANDFYENLGLDTLPATFGGELTEDVLRRAREQEVNPPLPGSDDLPRLTDAEDRLVRAFTQTTRQGGFDLSVDLPERLSEQARQAQAATQSLQNLAAIYRQATKDGADYATVQKQIAEAEAEAAAARIRSDPNLNQQERQAALERLEAQTALTKAEEAYRESIDETAESLQEALEAAEERLKVESAYTKELRDALAAGANLDEARERATQASEEEAIALGQLAEGHDEVNAKLREEQEIRSQLEGLANFEERVAQEKELLAVREQTLASGGSIAEAERAVERQRLLLTLGTNQLSGANKARAEAAVDAHLAVREAAEAEQRALDRALLTTKDLRDSFREMVRGALRGTRDIGDIGKTLADLGKSVGANFFEQFLFGKQEKFDQPLIGNIQGLVGTSGIIPQLFQSGGAQAAQQFGAGLGANQAGGGLLGSLGLQAGFSAARTYLLGTGSTTGLLNTPIGAFNNYAIGNGPLGIGNFSLGQFAGGAGAGYLGYGLGTGLTSQLGFRSGTGSQVAGGIGGAAGFLLGGPLGAGIGSFFGGALGSLFDGQVTRISLEKEAIEDFVEDVFEAINLPDISVPRRESTVGRYLGPARQTDLADVENALRAAGIAFALGQEDGGLGTVARVGNQTLAGAGRAGLSEQELQAGALGLARQLGVDSAEDFIRTFTRALRGGFDRDEFSRLEVLENFAENADETRSTRNRQVTLIETLAGGIDLIAGFAEGVDSLGLAARLTSQEIEQALQAQGRDTAEYADVIQQVRDNALGAAQALTEIGGLEFDDLTFSVEELEAALGRVTAQQQAIEQLAGTVIAQGISQGFGRGRIEQEFSIGLNTALREALIQQTVAEELKGLFEGIDLTQPIAAGSDAAAQLATRVGDITDNVQQLLAAAGLLPGVIGEAAGPLEDLAVTMDRAVRALARLEAVGGAGGGAARDLEISLTRERLAGIQDSTAPEDLQLAIGLVDRLADLTVQYYQETIQREQERLALIRQFASGLEGQISSTLAAAAQFQGGSTIGTELASARDAVFETWLGPDGVRLSEATGEQLQAHLDALNRLSTLTTQYYQDAINGEQERVATAEQAAAAAESQAQAFAGLSAQIRGLADQFRTQPVSRGDVEAARGALDGSVDALQRLATLTSNYYQGAIVSEQERLAVAQQAAAAFAQAAQSLTGQITGLAGAPGGLSGTQELAYLQRQEDLVRSQLSGATGDDQARLLQELGQLLTAQVRLDAFDGDPRQAALFQQNLAELEDLRDEANRNAEAAQSDAEIISASIDGLNAQAVSELQSLQAQADTHAAIATTAAHQAQADAQAAREAILRLQQEAVAALEGQAQHARNLAAVAHADAERVASSIERTQQQVVQVLSGIQATAERLYNATVSRPQNVNFSVNVTGDTGNIAGTLEDALLPGRPLRRQLDALYG